MPKLPRLSSNSALYLSIFSFLFIASFTLSLTKLLTPSPTKIAKTSYSPEVNEYPAIPLRKDNALDPEISASSVLAIDLDSRVTVLAKNPDEQLFPASTTKMITALTALDYYELEDTIIVKNVNVGGQRMRLFEGEEIKVSDLISGLLIFSANDAAEVLASNFCKLPKGDEIDTIVDGDLTCGRDAFISAMNFKARELNLENSHFVNPTGLDSEEHLTTARDLVMVAVESMNNDTIRKLVGTKEAVVSSLDGSVQHKLTNLNELLGEVDGVLGVKTGWTEMAKENLVTYIDRDGKKIVIVVLGSEDRFGETKKVIDWIFENYEWRDIRV